MKFLAYKNRFAQSLALALAATAFNASAATIVDADSDGLIEINNLDDLNEIRNDVTGKTFRGSSDGCPSTGCFGWELTRNLDFDSNKNGVIDASDWNGGQSWVPIPYTNNVVFEGNSYGLSNLLITTPQITTETLSNGSTIDEYKFGFFSGLRTSTIRNLKLINTIVLADGAPMPTDSRLRVGGLVGLIVSSQLINISMENATIDFDRPSILAKLTTLGSIGGLVGYANAAALNNVLTNVHFTGFVTVNDNLQEHDTGGIAGYLRKTTVSQSSAQGTILGATAGGLAATAYSCTFSRSYSTANVTATRGNAAGFIVMSFDNKFDSVYTSGAVTAPANMAVAGMVIYDGTNGSVELRTSYSTSILNGTSGFLVAAKSPNTVFLNIDSYQVSDPAGTTLLSSGAHNRTITKAELACASNPINNSCSNPQALSSWDPAAWDFGSTTELPLLRQESNFPWVSVDKPNTGQGDFEPFSEIKAAYPNYVCDNPIDFQAKEKKSGYVFNAKTPEKFDFFNAVQGLQCTASAQANGKCANYEVSYLCDLRSVNGSTYWTPWASGSNPANGATDTEIPPNGVCSNGITAGIRARAVNTPAEYYGAPQKIGKFNLTYGFSCKNSDNGAGIACKDYETRMVCSVKSVLTNP